MQINVNLKINLYFYGTTTINLKHFFNSHVVEKKYTCLHKSELKHSFSERSFPVQTTLSDRFYHQA